MAVIDLDAILADAQRNSLTRDNPALADLPGWFSGYRDHQRIAIREILTAYEEGAQCVVLDAPTGSGKTLIGETVRRLLGGRMGGERTTSYICSSKTLQDQFVRDYPYARVLKGRSNYATERYPERFGGTDGLSCADCTKQPGEPESCMWCVRTDACPYERAKGDALRSSLAVLNTSYFLSECNGPGRFSRGGLVIADEADCLESELMSHVEVRISERRLKQYGLGTPKKITVEDSWIEWAREAVEKVGRYRPRPGVEVAAIREQKRHAILLSKLRLLEEGLGSGGWVYTGDRNAVAFKPVQVNQLGKSKLWQHGDKWLLMSATVISADEMLESLGWDDEKEWRLVKCPSTFTPENRKVIVWPVASMTYKEREESYPKLAKAIGEIVDSHPADRVLIHSTSYDLTKYLVGQLAMASGGGGYCRPVLTLPCPTHTGRFKMPGCLTCRPGEGRTVFSYASSADKDRALSEYLATPAAILVAPSMDRGIDLPGDACGVQILCKVPFLNLKDKQVSARLYATGRSGKVWYAVNALRTIIQSCGRAVRSEEDWAVSYILDSQFRDNLYSGYRNLVPEWWKASLEWRKGG